MGERLLEIRGLKIHFGTDDGVVHVAEAQGEAARLADIDVVVVPLRVAVARELGVLDDDVALGVDAAQDAHLVAVEVAVAHREAGAFGADPGAVAMAHRRARELDVLDQRAAALDHPDRLALGVRPGGVQARPAARAAQREIVLRPDCDVARVVPGVDLHDGAVARDARCVARALKHAAGTDAQDLRLGGGARGAERRDGKQQDSVAHGGPI